MTLLLRKTEDRATTALKTIHDEMQLQSKKRYEDSISQEDRITIISLSIFTYKEGNIFYKCCQKENTSNKSQQEEALKSSQTRRDFPIISSNFRES